MKSMLLGVTWYRGKEDYDRLKAMAKDGEVLPDTYEEWLRKAEEVSGQMALRGFTVVKVYLDPETFLDEIRNLAECRGRHQVRPGVTLECGHGGRVRSVPPVQQRIER